MIGVMRQQLAPRRVEAMSFIVSEEMLEPRGVQIDMLLDRERVGSRVGAMAEDGAKMLIE